MSIAVLRYFSTEISAGILTIALHHEGRIYPNLHLGFSKGDHVLFLLQDRIRTKINMLTFQVAQHLLVRFIFHLMINFLEFSLTLNLDLINILC